MRIDGDIFGAARRALDEFGVAPDAHIEFIKFRENHVFRVRADGTDRALRLHRPGYRTDAELESEVIVLRAFREHGVTVPAPVAAPAGGHIVTFADPRGVRRQASMQEWIANARPIGDTGAVFDGRESPDTAVLRALGALMAGMHTVAEALGRPAGFGRPAWDRAGLVGPAALWNTASDLRPLTDDQRYLLRAAETRLGKELDALPRGSADYGIIHADFSFENVLRADDGELAVLDMDDSGEGWYLFDIATPAFFCSRHPRARALIGAIAEGYASHRALSAESAEAWHHLLMARALTYLGWSVTRPQDPTTEYHVNVLLPWILEAAQTYVCSGTTGWPSLAAVGSPAGAKEGP